MTESSFLPEDYLAQRAERRTNIVSLTLFGVVMIAVVAAFFVTNRQGRMVKNLQATINSQYQDAGRQIEELTKLENQKTEMLEKAELAAALVERVPRSILLAELINRMPERLSLLEFDMKSEKIKAPPPKAEKDSKGRLVAPGSKRGKTKKEADDPISKIEPPRYRVSIAMTGVAPTDLEVSKYMTDLNAYPLVKRVTLVYSEEKEVDARMMRQFQITMNLDPSADVRQVDPMSLPQIKDPMQDDVHMMPPAVSNATSGRAGREEGR